MAFKLAQAVFMHDIFEVAWVSGRRFGVYLQHLASGMVKRKRMRVSDFRSVL
jgi:hypothetical protein